MITLNVHSLTRIGSVPELPFVTLDTLDADYPRDERTPQAAWKVSIACGKGGAGAFGYGPTLDIALARAAVNGWTPVRAYVVEIVWDKHWSGGAPRRVCQGTIRRGKGTWAEQIVDCVIAASQPEKAST